MQGIEHRSPGRAAEPLNHLFVCSILNLYGILDVGDLDGEFLKAVLHKVKQDNHLATCCPLSSGSEERSNAPNFSVHTEETGWHCPGEMSENGHLDQFSEFWVQTYNLVEGKA